MTEENPFTYYDGDSQNNESQHNNTGRGKTPRLSHPQNLYQQPFMFQPQPDMLKLISKVGSIVFHIAKDLKKFREDVTEKIENLEKKVDQHNESCRNNFDIQTAITISALGERVKTKNLQITSQYDSIKTALEQIKEIYSKEKQKKH